jgi:hypothetical protein
MDTNIFSKTLEQALVQQYYDDKHAIIPSTTNGIGPSSRARDNQNSPSMDDKPSPRLIQPSADREDVLFAEALQTAIARGARKPLLLAEHAESEENNISNKKNMHSCQPSQEGSV